MAFVKITAPKRELKRLKSAEAPVRISVIKTGKLTDKLRVVIIFSAELANKLRGTTPLDELYLVALEGTREHEGLICLQPSDKKTEGSVKVGLTNKQKCARIYLPNMTERMPKVVTKVAACALVSIDVANLVFRLPDSWTAAPKESDNVMLLADQPKNQQSPGIPINTRAAGLIRDQKPMSRGFQPSKPVAPKVSRVVKKPTVAFSGKVFNILGQDVTGALDVIRPIEYLRRKGYTLTKHPAEGMWQIRGSEFSSTDTSQVARLINTTELVAIINKERDKLGVASITAAHLVDENALENA
jgi:hypothetical protein